MMMLNNRGRHLDESFNFDYIVHVYMHKYNIN